MGINVILHTALVRLGEKNFIKAAINTRSMCRFNAKRRHDEKTGEKSEGKNGI